MLVPPFLAAVLGVFVIVLVLWDAFETMLVPRRIGRRVRLTRYFYMLTWRLWRAVALKVRKPADREATLGFYAPLSLLGLLVCWASGMVLGFALLQLAASPAAPLSFGRAGMLFYMSGETFFTLGFGDVVPATGLGRLLSVLESGMGFGFLGTVVSYLPTLYGAFSQREIEISLLDARAGSPPTAAEFLARIPAAGDGLLPAMLRDWERWSAQVLETHISYPLLVYYRSQHSNQSWLGALTAILDSTALILAGTEGLPKGQARLTFAIARHAMVDLTQIFVPRFAPGGADRLPAAELERLRAQLRMAAIRLPDTPEHATKLAELRRMYEPYAQALAEHLLLDLPPWIHAESRKDNWRGGPWDKSLGVRHASVFVSDDHF